MLGVTPLDLKIRRRGALYWLKKENQNKVKDILGKEAHSALGIKQETRNIRQVRWNTSTKGRRVHSFLPDVKEIFQLNQLQPTEGLLHFLSGHGPYAVYFEEVSSRQNNL